MDSQQSKVLGIVIKNETEQGAQCPKDFSMLGINEEKLREILDQLADDGQFSIPNNFLILFFRTHLQHHRRRPLQVDLDPIESFLTAPY